MRALGLTALLLCAACGADNPFERGAPIEVIVPDGGGGGDAGNPDGGGPFSDAGPAISFKDQVDPIFVTKACTACHAGGAGGLTLTGIPATDYAAAKDVTDLAHPSQSLLYVKPTGLVAHGGGALLDTSSNEAKLILSWIEQGALNN